MSKFSEHLDQAVINSGLTETQLSKLSGFTRSYIALIKSGRRVPPDRGKIAKLIDALNLSPHERDELWSEYMRARLGDDTYKINESIVDFIQSFNQISSLNIKSSFFHEIPHISTVTNRIDLEYFLRAVCENESRKENGFLYIMIQNDTSVLTNVIYEILANSKNLTIEHILCLDSVKEGRGEEILYNISLLKNLMPLALSNYSKNYEVFYYYNSVVSRSGLVSLIPFFLITSDYVINISEQMDSAVILKNKEISAFYGEKFQKQKQKCKKLFLRMDDHVDFAESYIQSEIPAERTYTISSQPCFGVLNLTQFINKYYNFGNKQIAQMIESLNIRNSAIYENENAVQTTYCTKEGILRFIETGRIDEIPKEMYKEIQLKDRITILKMLLECIKKKKTEIYLIDEQKLKLPKDLFLIGFGISNVRIQVLSERRNVRFIVNESSLSKVMYEFLSKFYESDYVGSLEKTVAFMEDIVLRFSEKNK